LEAEVLIEIQSWIPLPLRKKKNQEKKQEDPRILFVKMRRRLSGFRSSGGLAFLQGETEEESCSKWKKTQEVLGTKDWAPEDQSSEKL